MFETNRFKDGDSVCPDVPAGSDPESSDQTGTQVTETQRVGVNDSSREQNQTERTDTDLRMSPYRLGITRTSNWVGSWTI